jgi:hypothetical protein
MNHPLLTRWLTDNLYGLDEYTTRDEVAAQMIEDSPDIADRLERALGECQWENSCGVRPDHPVHKPHRTYCTPDHAPYIDCHPYQPLVAP